MEIAELIEDLKKDAQRIKEEWIELIDFDRLEENLRVASDKLRKMKEKDGVAEKILKDFKSEIKRLALSLSRLKNENGTSELAEKYLSDPEIGYEELCLLKRNLEAELSKIFPGAPVAESFYSFAVGQKVGDRIEEYKV